jgi:DNA ligase (NAD+)
VFVEKGGEIIPKVTAIDFERRPLGAQTVEYILRCPECDTLLIRIDGEAAHYCPNETGCPPQIKGRLEHFIQRKALDIDSLGEKNIEKLYEKGFIKTPADIYDLTEEKLLSLDKVKSKTAKNMLAGIEQSKRQPFEAVLFGIGIRYVGKTVAEKLARYFKSIDALANASLEELQSAPEVGEKIAESVFRFFRKAENQAEIARLRQAGLQLASTLQEAEKISDLLSAKSFVISGVFENYSREQLQEMVVANGGKILSSVSGKLDYLLAGDAMGPAKKEKAEKLGVKIISLDDFKQMLNG